MGNPYPATFEDPTGTRDVLIGEINFDDPANQPGGAANLIVVRFAVNLFLLSTIETLFNTLQGGDSFGGQSAGGTVTGPPRTVAPADNVVSGSDVAITTSGVVPSTPDDLDFNIRGVVTDAAAANLATISVFAAVAAPVTDTAFTLGLAAGAWAINAGTDLSDDGSGGLVSAAGGVYQAVFVAAVDWD